MFKWGPAVWLFSFFILAMSVLMIPAGWTWQ